MPSLQTESKETNEANNMSNGNITTTKKIQRNF